MKTSKQTKFLFEKYEIAKFKKIKIVGGTGTTNGDPDPDTGTKTSENCSTKPGCQRDPNDPDPINPFDPDPNTEI
ncbi:hypothetical protein [Flavobacterium sp. HNIBRBA15423]|uniref:hypothetical protein n=1 Tax=Flavobacterium sp. HNIBRBA15423 TaxID=3458683 RepID=UPI0040446B21